MTQDTSRLVGKSRQDLWPIAVLLPATALLAWVGYDVWAAGTVAQTSGRGSWIGKMPPDLVIGFFWGTALICLACVALALRRRLMPRDELVLDPDGVTTDVIWGRGTLRWSEITRIELQQGWMFAHGQQADGGKRKKLTVAITQLDRSADDILAFIHRHRPDLFP